MSIVLGCASVQSHWKEAESKNTIAAYEEFLKFNRYSEFSNEAQSRIEKLRFQEVKDKDQILYYVKFLADYPKSKYLQDVQTSLDKKKKILKSLQTKKVKIESNGEQDIDLILLTTSKDIITRMGCEIVPSNSTNFDCELRIGKTRLDALGATALGGSPYVLLGYQTEVTFNHQQEGTVFEIISVSPVDLVKLVDKDGRLVRSSPTDPEREEKMAKDGREKLQVLFQTQIAEYFEEYLGKGIEPLIEDLKSENSFLQEKSADSLRRLGDTRTIEPLIAVLADEDKDVRKSAIEALRKLTGQELVEDITIWQDWWQQNKQRFKE